MAHEKYEPRLANFLEIHAARARAGRAEARAAAEAEPIEVTISHHDSLRADEGGPPAAAFEALGDRVRASQSGILARLRELGVRNPVVHTLANAVTARLTPSQLSDVSQLDEVKIIRLEHLDPVTCMDGSVHVIESAEAVQDLGVNGRGIRVAVLDTGMDKNHPALLGKVVDEVSTAGEAIAIPGAHGTHTAGTVASNDPVFRGVAPQADLLNIKVLTAAGFGTPAGVIQGFDQAVRRGALVASLSLGWSEIFHGWICNNADCILCQAADNTVALGVTVVVAAGNEGAAGALPPFAIRHPGAARRVITVAAVDKAKVLAAFSSVGPASGRVSPTSPIRLTKPDVAAPGVNITSSVLGGGFSAFSGTSMATPHVAGVAALILQKARNLTPAMVKKIIEGTSEPLPLTPNQGGYGLVNAYAAVLRAALSA